MIYEICDAVRRVLIEHLANQQSLQLPSVFTPNTVLLNPGDPNVFVDNSSRFRVGDEVIIASDIIKMFEKTKIIEIPDWNQIIISPPSAKPDGWKVSESPYILKTIGYRPLKRVVVGDLRIYPDYPSIAVVQQSENNEWMTLGGTSHEYRIPIRVYIQTDNFETSQELCSKMSEQVREILIDHFHLVVDGSRHFLTADMTGGGLIVKIADTSDFYPGANVLIRDAARNTQLGTIRTVLDDTTLELEMACEDNFLIARQAEIILLRKYLYDTRPSEINYGFVPGGGGSFVVASEISYYAKQFVCRGPGSYT